MEDDIRWMRTHCGRMDHGGCAVLVGIKDNKIVKVKGDPDGFLNKGYVCLKGLASPDRLSHPDRLKYPLKRIGKRGEGKWERISWPDAIDEISENFNRIKIKYGAKGVAFCQGMPKGLELFVLIRLANIFGSPNVVGIQDVCHIPREITGIHSCGFYPVTDFHHTSKLVLLWGSNITSTNEEGAICSLLLNQTKNGTKLIGIDPKKTELTDRAKFWLQIRPGSDNALALAFLNVVIEERLYDRAFVENWTSGFDELADHVREYTPEKMSDATWIPANLIRDAARFYAQSRPAAIQWGNPIEQNMHTFDTVRALVCLMAICGNLDVPGGNIQANEPKTCNFGQFVRADLIPSKKKEMIHTYHHSIPRLMNVAPAFFRKAVLEEIPYPVKGAYMHGTNPLLAYADSRKTYKTLINLDYLVVSDIFMTPTAAFANMVLPAATQFEFNDIGHWGMGHGVILARPKVVDPPEECWPDIKILNELGKALTSDEHWYDDYEELLEEVVKPSGLSYKEFSDKGFLKGKDQFQKYVLSGFKTPSGKVELCLSQAEKFNLPSLPRFDDFLEESDPRFPLVLTSSKSRYYLHSSYRWIDRLRKHRPYPKTEIHPETAATYGIQEGDEVIVETAQGEIIQKAHLTERIHPKVINAAYGWWFPEEKAESQYDWEKSNFNILTSMEKLGKEFGTPNLKGIECNIRKKSSQKTMNSKSNQVR